ncbi:recombinase family protein [Streptomyces sp. B-S-A12]|uniref:Recombinase family protein n=1 Tax=Streptomyces luteolus TaxID=3043615 RepID=A0ABT6SS98_9ACTN|nr:recombinase family protein [Streptomyces sp. B-S-A12]MDI3418483.1 recombinase family protein [Streptomyces sp. B-S-A12]
MKCETPGQRAAKCLRTRREFDHRATAPSPHPAPASPDPGSPDAPGCRRAPCTGALSTRIKVRPEFVKAMDLARTIKKAVPHQRVVFTLHEMKRLGRGAAELLAIADELRHHDIQLELLTGPLQGVYDPSGHGAALFAFFAGMAESEREYIREKSLEGQPSARERGRQGGRPKAVDDDMAAYARSLRANGVSVPEIARNLVITSGKNQGKRPSVATVYRILAEDSDSTE